MLRKKAKPPSGRPPVILRRGEHDYAVLVWRADVDGEPVYEVAHGEIGEAEVAATLAKREREGRSQTPAPSRRART